MIDMDFTIGSKHATCICEETKHKVFMHPINSEEYTNHQQLNIFYYANQQLCTHLCLIKG